MNFSFESFYQEYRSSNGNGRAVIEKYLDDMRRNFDNTFPSGYMDRIEMAIQSEDHEEAVHYLKLIDAVSKVKRLRSTSQNSSVVPNTI